MPKYDQKTPDFGLVLDPSCAKDVLRQTSDSLSDGNIRSYNDYLSLMTVNGIQAPLAIASLIYHHGSQVHHRPHRMQIVTKTHGQTFRFTASRLHSKQLDLEHSRRSIYGLGRIQPISALYFPEENLSRARAFEFNKLPDGGFMTELFDPEALENCHLSHAYTHTSHDHLAGLGIEDPDSATNQSAIEKAATNFDATMEGFSRVSQFMINSLLDSTT